MSASEPANLEAAYYAQRTTAKELCKCIGELLHAMPDELCFTRSDLHEMNQVTTSLLHLIALIESNEERRRERHDEQENENRSQF